MVPRRTRCRFGAAARSWCAAALSLALSAGCAAEAASAYDPPDLPAARLAVVESNGTVGVTAVDGLQTGESTGYGTEVPLEPGRRVLRLWVIPAYDGSIPRAVELTHDFSAGERLIAEGVTVSFAGAPKASVTLFDPQTGRVAAQALGDEYNRPSPPAAQPTP